MRSRNICLPSPETISAIANRYGLEMKFETIPQLVADHGLKSPGAK